MIDNWIILFIGCTLSILVFYALIRIWPKSGKMGISTKTISCPQCGLKAPMIRRPANLKQFLWGGWTCAKCKCEFDKYGNEINT